MGTHKRLVGIDVFRALAIYAVIIVHIDEGVEITSPSWAKITNLASFPVPFFLAAAFYLAISKLYNSQAQYPILSRLSRLLIPYVVWSSLYLLYKSAKYMATDEFSRLSELFQDPLSLVFFGGASYHLYFLPLLATGTLLIKLVEPLIRKNISLKGLGLFGLISLVAYELILVSGNGFNVSANVAFRPLLAAVLPDGNSNPLLRLLLVGVVWSLRCLPYIMVAMLLAHPTINHLFLKVISKHPIGCLLTFFIFNSLGSLLMPQAVKEVVVGYTALTAAIAISSVLRDNPLIKSIGLCSFGIYLVHIFFVEIFQSIAIRLYPDYAINANSLRLLTASTFVLLSSWLITLLLMRNKRISQVLYGA